MDKKVSRIAVAAICLAASATLAGGGAGSAAADTPANCKNMAPVQTTGNAVNDLTQQANGTLGNLLDTANCTVGTANGAVNGSNQTTEQ
ncbi:hypothetical protein ACFY41_01790 [Streptomyces syringium]|uniref:hypothetical protein n=1 Tax=Streptomyces syringium TaxID=76729 RepID=UPI00368B9118